MSETSKMSENPSCAACDTIPALFKITEKTQGLVSFINNGHEFCVKFVDGKMVDGLLTCPVGYTYRGEWSNSMFVKGTCVYPDKSVYIGSMLHRMRHGKGTYIHSNGKVISGTWIMDEVTGISTVVGNNSVKVHRYSRANTGEVDSTIHVCHITKTAEFRDFTKESTPITRVDYHGSEVVVKNIVIVEPTNVKRLRSDIDYQPSVVESKPWG